jgi:signal peptidase II
MKKESIKKYAIFLVAVAVLVAVDQWTKIYAEARLATPGLTDVELEVADEHDGWTVEEFLGVKLRANSEEEVAEMAARHTVTYDGLPLSGQAEVAAGDRLRVLRREVVVIEDYWDFQYTRNPGAAFGLLADADESFRGPFFNIVSLLAVILILGLLRGVPLRQHLFFWGLTLILAGALGNYVDRLAYGYVIDFVVWKYTDDYRWPTFNVADVLICVGVGMLVVEMIRETIHEMRHGKEDDSESKESEEVANA